MVKLWGKFLEVITISKNPTSMSHKFPTNLQRRPRRRRGRRRRPWRRRGRRGRRLVALHRAVRVPLVPRLPEPHGRRATRHAVDAGGGERGQVSLRSTHCLWIPAKQSAPRGSTEWGRRIGHRKWREARQQPSTTRQAVGLLLHCFSTFLDLNPTPPPCTFVLQSRKFQLFNWTMYSQDVNTGNALR